MALWDLDADVLVAFLFGGEGLTFSVEEEDGDVLGEAVASFAETASSAIDFVGTHAVGASTSVELELVCGAALKLVGGSGDAGDGVLCEASALLARSNLDGSRTTEGRHCGCCGWRLLVEVDVMHRCGGQGAVGDGDDGVVSRHGGGRLMVIRRAQSGE